MTGCKTCRTLYYTKVWLQVFFLWDRNIRQIYLAENSTASRKVDLILTDVMLLLLFK